MKIVTVVGARPQFVKAAVVSRLFKAEKDIEEVIIHTGQHFDNNMSDVFFEEMNIPKPNYNLSISGVGHGAMTGRMLEGIEEILIKEKPDWVMVYGDTNSTLAGALAAKKLHIKLCHVEAGLRSYNMKMPEEINRVLTDQISDILLIPTEVGKQNLEKEGFTQKDVSLVITGDIMYDAALFYSKQVSINEKSNDEKYLLATCHRAENTDDPDKLKDIVNALNTIHKECRVVLPLHPRTKKKLEEFQLKLEVDTLEPVGYLEMIKLIGESEMILTDSGGLQKEAYFFKKPCITLREETEWVELVHSGCNVLTGSDKSKIVEGYQNFLKQEPDFSNQFYGNGDAGEKIIQAIKEFS